MANRRTPQCLRRKGCVIVAYHGSSVPIRRFNPAFYAPEGGFWFSEDKNKILRGESGAVDTKYLMEVRLRVDKIAGWDEYDRYLTDQLLALGYDSVKLDDDWIVFDPDRIEVVSADRVPARR